MANILIIAIGAILINNFVLSRFLGLCPFVGVSKKTETAIGMGMAVIFVMTLASAVTWTIWAFFLSPGESNLFWIIARALGSGAEAHAFDLRYLNTIAFILVIASLVQFVELVLKKMSPALYESLGIFLPLITTNCAILGVAELNTMTLDYNFIESLVHGISAGIGFTLALIMMSGIRERLEFAPVPKLMRGLPIAFIIAGLMSMAFLGFSGLKF
ncbi:MAG TPA: electron transport complex subunit RsxA [candidate division Zixibacteria bacterium]|nr:electron transport complex subunit RsxA [candidate division Zixibacteria bacterium]